MSTVALNFTLSTGLPSKVEILNDCTDFSCSFILYLWIPDTIKLFLFP